MLLLFWLIHKQFDKCATGFPIIDARLLKYSKSIFHIILPFLSSLSRSGIFLIFEKRASFLGNPVYMSLEYLLQYYTNNMYLFINTKMLYERESWIARTEIYLQWTAFSRIFLLHTISERFELLLALLLWYRPDFTLQQYLKYIIFKLNYAAIFNHYKSISLLILFNSLFQYMNSEIKQKILSFSYIWPRCGWWSQFK